MIFENLLPLIVRERNPVTGETTHLNDDPEKLLGIKELELPPSEGWHLG